YGTAWAAVHSLVLGDRRRHERFLAYLNLLTAGEVSASEAWARTLKQDELGLEHDMQGIRPRTELENGEIEFVPPALPSASVRTMTPAEVHLSWAEIRPWTTPA